MKYFMNNPINHSANNHPQSKPLLIAFIALLSAVSPAQAETTSKVLDYDELTAFSNTYQRGSSESVASVTKNGQISYMSIEGKLLLPFKERQDFEVVNNNAFIIKKNDLYGIVDKSGKVLLPFNYRRIKEMSPHFFSGSLEKDGKATNDVIVYRSGKFIVKPSCREFEKVYDDEIGVCRYYNPNISWRVFVDSEGNQGQTKYKAIQSVADKKWFIVQSYENEHYGIVDFTRKTIVPMTFNDIKVLDNGLIAYKNQRGYWGLLDNRGKQLVDAQYDRIDNVNLSSQLVKFSLDSRDGLLNALGKEVIPPKYHYMRKHKGFFIFTTPENKEHYFTPTLQPVVLPDDVDSYELIGERIVFNKEKGNKQLADLAGNIIIPPKYKYLSPLGEFFEAKKYTQSRDLLTGVLDKNGKVIVPVEYSKITPAGDFFIAKKNGEGRRDIFSIYTNKGEVLFKPQAFSYVTFNEEFNVFLLLDGKSDYTQKYVGHVDTSGKVSRVNLWKYRAANLINPQLDQARLKRKLWGVFDRDGKQLLPFEYKNLFTIIGFFDKIFYKKDELYGVMTRAGDIITKPRFEEIGRELYYEEKRTDLEKAFPLVTVKRNQHWGLYIT